MVRQKFKLNQCSTHKYPCNHSGVLWMERISANGRLRWPWTPPLKKTKQHQNKKMSTYSLTQNGISNVVFLARKSTVAFLCERSFKPLQHIRNKKMSEDFQHRGGVSPILTEEFGPSIHLDSKIKLFECGRLTFVPLQKGLSFIVSSHFPSLCLHQCVQKECLS